MASFTLLIAIGILCAYPLYRLLQIGRRHPRMPPGPPTIPILGNAHQIPITGLGKKYHDLNRESSPAPANVKQVQDVGRHVWSDIFIDDRANKHSRFV